MGWLKMAKGFDQHACESSTGPARSISIDLAVSVPRANPAATGNFELTWSLETQPELKCSLKVLVDEVRIAPIHSDSVVVNMLTGIGLKKEIFVVVNVARNTTETKRESCIIKGEPGNCKVQREGDEVVAHTMTRMQVCPDSGEMVWGDSLEMGEVSCPHPGNIDVSPLLIQFIACSKEVDGRISVEGVAEESLADLMQAAFKGAKAKLNTGVRSTLETKKEN